MHLRSRSCLWEHHSFFLTFVETTMNEIKRMTIKDLLSHYLITESELHDIIDASPQYGLIWSDSLGEVNVPEGLVALIKSRFSPRTGRVEPYGLKIVGKIDLYKFDPKKGKKRERIKRGTAKTLRDEVEELRESSSQNESQVMSKEQEIEAAYEELEEQRELEWREWEEQSSPVFWTYEEYLEHLENESIKKRAEQEKASLILENELILKKEESLYQRINEIRRIVQRHYHIEITDTGEFLFAYNQASSLPKGYLYLFDHTAATPISLIGLFDLSEKRVFAFSPKQERATSELDSLFEHSIYLIDSNGSVIESFVIKKSFSISLQKTHGEWMLLSIRQISLIFVVNYSGECMFVFPQRECRIHDEREGQSLLEYHDNEMFILDYNNHRIIRRQGISKRVPLDYYFRQNGLRYETRYVNKDVVEENTAYFGSKKLLPRKIYDSFDSFISSSWIIIIGIFEQECDIFQSRLRLNDNYDSLSEGGCVQHVEFNSYSWFEKRTGPLCKRFPLLLFDGQKQEKIAVLEDRRFRFGPKSSISLTFVYQDIWRAQLRWAEKYYSGTLHKNYMKTGIVELEDIKDNESIFVCGDNIIFNQDGSVYHKFNSNTLLVDTWYNYLAFSQNNCFLIYQFVHGISLRTYLDKKLYPRPKLVSPLYGQITDLINYDVFVDKYIRPTSSPNSFILATDSFGEVYGVDKRIQSRIRESRWLQDHYRSKNREDLLVLCTASGYFIIIHRMEPVLIEVPSSVFDDEYSAKLIGHERYQFLNIDSVFACFDVVNRIFTPVPWIKQVIDEYHDLELDSGRANYSDDIGIIDALDGDWDNYWNID